MALLNPQVALAISIWVMTLIDVFVGPENLDRFQKWLWSTPQEQHQAVGEGQILSEEAEALFVQAQRFMDMQYEVTALRRQTLALPALPEEGF